jgi:hypothetical protein
LGAFLIHRKIFNWIFYSVELIFRKEGEHDNLALGIQNKAWLFRRSKKFDTFDGLGASLQTP